jgi:hypothetical protein
LRGKLAHRRGDLREESLRRDRDAIAFVGGHARKARELSDVAAALLSAPEDNRRSPFWRGHDGAMNLPEPSRLYELL